MIFLWIAAALTLGGIVAFLAREKNRSPILWGIYGALLSPLALPHILLARARTDETWAPTRFAIPDAVEQSCPHCNATVRGEAIVCRHCRQPLYGGPVGLDDGEPMADDQAQPAAEDRPEPTAGEPAANERPKRPRPHKPADEVAIKWMEASFARMADATQAEAPHAELHADPYARVTQPETPRDRAPDSPVQPHETAKAERVRHEALRIAPEARRTEPEPAPETLRPTAPSEQPHMEEPVLAAAPQPRAPDNTPQSAPKPPQPVQGESQGESIVNHRPSIIVRPDAEPSAPASKPEPMLHRAEKPEPPRRSEPVLERPAAHTADERREAPRGLRVEPGDRAGARVEAPPRPLLRIEPGTRSEGALSVTAGHEERTRAPLSTDPSARRPEANDNKGGKVRKIAAFAAVAAAIGFLVPWLGQYLPTTFTGTPRNQPQDVAAPAVMPPQQTQGESVAAGAPAETAPAAQPQGESREVARAKLALPPTIPESARRAPAPPSAATEQNLALATQGLPAKAEPKALRPAEPEARPEAEPPAQSKAQPKAAPPAKSEPKAAPKAVAKAAPKAAPKAEPAQPRTQAPEDFMAMVNRALRGGAPAAAATAQEDVSAAGQLVQAVQERLRDRGYDPGSIDGRAGPKTQQAIRTFQQSVGMKPDGQIDMALMERLGIVGQQLHVFGR